MESNQENISKQKILEIPQHYLCPITQEIMKDPVLIADGISYERSSIEEWFKQHDTSPMTGQKLSNKNIISNITLRQLINQIETELLGHEPQKNQSSEQSYWENYIKDQQQKQGQQLLNQEIQNNFIYDVIYLQKLWKSEPNKHEFIKLAQSSADWTLNQLDEARQRIRQNQIDVKHYNLIISPQIPDFIIVSPKEQIEFKDLKCYVWNHDGNTCIQQIIWMLDENPVAQLYNGVPCSLKSFKQTVKFTAPSQEGVYLLWQTFQLQYSMNDAIKLAKSKDNVKECQNPERFKCFIKVQNSKEAAKPIEKNHKKSFFSWFK